MVKKITSTAFLLLVMVNHSFCEIRPNNNIEDKASKDLDKSAKSSSEIKANKNKSNQKHSTLTIGGILTIISTFFVILEKASIVLTGKPFTLASEEVKPASLEEIRKAGEFITLLNDQIRLFLLNHIQSNGLNNKFTLLKKELEQKNDVEIKTLFKQSLESEGYQIATGGMRWYNPQTCTEINHNFSAQDKVLHHFNNYIQALQLINQPQKL